MAANVWIIVLMFCQFIISELQCQMYMVNKYNLTFSNHESLCSFQYDSHLTSIHNTSQNTDALSLCSAASVTIGCFIGLNERTNANTLVWTDASFFNYGTDLSGGVYPWNTGEPAYYNGDACVATQTLYSLDSWCTTNCVQKLYALCTYPTPTYIFKDNYNYHRIPKTNNIIASIDILDELHIEFDIIINAFHPEYGAQYTNILQIGDSLYSIFMDENSKIFNISVTCAVYNKPKFNYWTDVIEIRKWYHLTFHLYQNQLILAIDNLTIHTENPLSQSHSILMDQNIYLSNSELPPSDVILSGLIISTSNSNTPGKWYNYFCDFSDRFQSYTGNWSFDKAACLVTKTNTGNGHVTWMGSPDKTTLKWVNYKAELVFTITSGEDSGLLFYGNTVSDALQGQFYLLHIHPTNQNIMLSIINNGAYTDLNNKYFDSSIGYNVEFRLRVEINDGTFDIYFQNEYIYSYTDDTFTSGSVGMRDWMNTAEYKSLRITFQSDDHLITVSPTNSPTLSPTISPTNSPTTTPTLPPTQSPIYNPTLSPIFAPTQSPSQSPTYPTNSPTNSPTFSPTVDITVATLSYVDVQYIILSIIMVIIILYILCKSCFKLYIDVKTKDSGMKNSVKIMTIAQMVSFLLCYLLWMIDIVLHHEIIFNVLQYFMFTMGWILLYVFMVHKLYYTFKDSIYRMSKTHIYFHIFITILIPIWYSCLSVSSEMVDSMTINIYLIVSAVGLTVIFIGLLTVIITFNKNLFHCYIIDQVRKHSYSVNFNANKQLNDVQISVLSVITKHTLLGTIIVSVELLFVITICVLTFLTQKRHNLSWVIFEWCLGLLILINLFCVYFGFQVNKDEYNKFCGAIHSKLLHCCEYLAYKYIRRKKTTAYSIDIDNDIYFMQINDDFEL